jgi:hypothetical protein
MPKQPPRNAELSRRSVCVCRVVTLKRKRGEYKRGILANGEGLKKERKTANKKDSKQERKKKLFIAP